MMKLLLASTVAALAVPLPASALAASAQEKVSGGRGIQPDAQIRVWNPTGSVQVTGWNRDSIAVIGTSARGAGRLFVAGGGAAAKVGFEGEGTADLEIRVPTSSSVWVKTASADVAAGGLTGAIDLSTVTGSIRVDGTLRHLAAESMGGDVELTTLASTIRAKTGSGSITLRGSGSDVTLSTVEGNIRVAGPRFERGRFETIAGRISFSGGLVRGGAIEFQSHDGPIDVQLPPKTGATFRISSYDGPVQSSFPAFRAHGRDLRGKELEFTNARGGAQVTIRTYQGAVTLKAPTSDVHERRTPPAGKLVVPKKAFP